MTPQLELAAITDEFSPDLETALAAMAAIGMTGAELRVVWGKNIMDLDDGEVRRAVDLIHARGMRVLAIGSPLLNRVLPGAPDADTRFQQDIFNSRHTFADQPRLAERALRLCELTGARIVRVFSYWRTVQPELCYGAICRALADLAALAAPRKSHRFGKRARLQHRHHRRILAVLGSRERAQRSTAYGIRPTSGRRRNSVPRGYAQLPAARIVHVHAKDCRLATANAGVAPAWVPAPSSGRARSAPLLAGGYRGAVSLETHWPGPAGDKLQASTICGWTLRGLLSA